MFFFNYCSLQGKNIEIWKKRKKKILLRVWQHSRDLEPFPDPQKGEFLDTDPLRDKCWFEALGKSVKYPEVSDSWKMRQRYDVQDFNP